MRFYEFLVAFVFRLKMNLMIQYDEKCSELKYFAAIAI
jgi:hypothetical protein